MTVTLSPNGVVTLAHDSVRPITPEYSVELSTGLGMVELSWARGPRGRIGDVLRPDGGRPQATGGECA